MDAATGVVLGAAIGAFSALIGVFGNVGVTWITKHYDERKERRELILKSAWDYYSTVLEVGKAIPGSKQQPFDAFLFYMVKVVDLALRKGLSDEQLLDS